MDADDASTADMRRRPDRDADPLTLDEETVERLLAGELSPAQVPPEYAGVAALLAATAAAPSQEELAGQAAALAELRAVTTARAATTRRATRPRRRRRIGLAAVAIAGALATGGAAVAATGNLPEPVRKVTRSILVTVGGAEPATSAPLPASTARLSDGGRAGQPPPPADATTGTPGTTGAAASLDLKSACRAYLAGQGAQNRKKLDATAFQALVRAARGEDKVQAYCQRLQPPSPQPDNTKPKDPKPKDQEPGPPADPGQEQGQGGPPPTNGGSGQGQGNPQATQSPSR
jgi:hypothetical protein